MPDTSYPEHLLLLPLNKTLAGIRLKNMDTNHDGMLSAAEATALAPLRDSANHLARRADRAVNPPLFTRDAVWDETGAFAFKTEALRRTATKQKCFTMHDQPMPLTEQLGNFLSIDRITLDVLLKQAFPQGIATVSLGTLLNADSDYLAAPIGKGNIAVCHRATTALA